MNEDIERNKAFTALVKDLGLTGNYDSKDWFTAGWEQSKQYQIESGRSLAQQIASYLRESSAVHRAAKLVELEKELRKMGVRL